MIASVQRVAPAAGMAADTTHCTRAARAPRDNAAALVVQVARRQIVWRHRYMVDIVDPHDETLSDAPAKARGMAAFASTHAKSFGRIELVKVVKGAIQRLELHTHAIRAEVAKVNDVAHLQLLYDTRGKP